ncbi:integrase catalytic domain-containing protein [Trichonephila clavipes]|nr:integrase catalytic domain-containing protein [Trichonephila clavipes]
MIVLSVLSNCPAVYMDDVLCGAATLEEAIVLRQQLKGILKSAGMELHKLCANHEKLSLDPEQNYNFATLTEPKIAVYCKSKNLKSETLVRLITSKSRVAPIKSLTIPRLELCAARILAKLVKRVVAALQLETAELYLWVAKIQELYPNQLWRHVPSDQNPADLVSRGVDPDKLLQQNLWFNGPTFLSAVHIELVSDLTSQAFIAALKRFMARRGKCTKLFSDNGKNFVGASNEIKKLLEIVRNSDEKLANYLAAEGIE